MYLQGGDDASGSAADGWMGFRVTQRAVGYDKHVQSESCATVSAEVKVVLLLYCKPPSHLRLQQVVMVLLSFPSSLHLSSHLPTSVQYLLFSNR